MSSSQVRAAKLLLVRLVDRSDSVTAVVSAPSLSLLNTQGRTRVTDFQFSSFRSRGKALYLIQVFGHGINLFLRIFEKISEKDFRSSLYHDYIRCAGKRKDAKCGFIPPYQDRFFAQLFLLRELILKLPPG